MSMQWARREHRLDVMLAVCLDAGANLLVRAKSERQLDEAVSFNLRLWRQIRELARLRPQWDEADALVHVADHVAALLALDACPCIDPRDIAFVAGRNLSLSCDLAGAAPLECSRDRMVADWAAQGGSQRFEQWLLERLDILRCSDRWG